jgi:universal stress protein E
MMLSFQRILVDIDPDREFQPALIRALQFAKDTKVTIKLLCCVYYPSVVANNFLDATQLEKTKTAILIMNENNLANLIEKYSAKNVTYETEVLWETPIYQGILRVADSFKTDLVIKATRPHPTIAKRFFTPTDWQLLKSCLVPILFVKHQQWPDMATVVTALDPAHNLSTKSELDKRILRNGYQAATQLNVPLHACHCFDPSYLKILFEALEVSGIWADVFSDNPEKDDASVLNKLRLQQNDQFVEVCSEMVPNSANQHLISGNIQSALPATLDKLHAGILVVGTTYRTGFLGSTAEKLLESVECDLLGVKPKDFEFFV